MGFIQQLISVVIFIHIYAFCVLGDCPTKLPLGIDGVCYKLQTDLLQFNEALENCDDLEPGSDLVNFLSQTPEKLEKEIKDFIESKIEKAYYWIGFKMVDSSTSKRLEDREWTFDYDNSTVIQKDFKVWAEQPRDSALSCATINGSREFKVVAVDCGGPRVPVVCMKTDDPCKDDHKPFMKYGNHCLLVLSGALEYNKIGAACSPDYPTPVKHGKMQKHVKNAILNSFLGGAIYVGVKRVNNLYIFLNGQMVPDYMWGDGEPRQDHDCAGLALQLDGSVKLRTLSCDSFASSLCSIKGT
ncbi:c-type lectin domain-containing protein [Nephila pilipes]|uniref:C-type lectin domain-containing protein n=1 Tax=Nephila pilipes TaxID=299642 RepID=A0A8X6UJD8_NEPPI|nr:c-type lectin domain-containing protein [Nephila pilipes]